MEYRVKRFNRDSYGTVGYMVQRKERVLLLFWRWVDCCAYNDAAEAEGHAARMTEFHKRVEFTQRYER